MYNEVSFSLKKINYNAFRGEITYSKAYFMKPTLNDPGLRLKEIIVNFAVSI